MEPEEIIKIEGGYLTPQAMHARVIFDERIRRLFEEEIQKKGLVLNDSQVLSSIRYDIAASVHDLTGYIWIEEANDSHVESSKVMVPQKPWWIPKFMWKRLKCNEHVLSIVYQPMWKYPEFAQAVGTGPFLRFMKSTRRDYTSGGARHSNVWYSGDKEQQERDGFFPR